MKFSRALVRTAPLSFGAEFLALFIASLFFSHLAFAEGSGLSPENLANKNPTQIMMQNKLHQMNELFAAVISGDVDKAKKSTQLLQTISKASEFQNLKNKAFSSHAITFQNSTEYMLEQINTRNKDGILLGYVRLTMACSYCHGTVRDNPSK